MRCRINIAVLLLSVSALTGSAQSTSEHGNGGQAIQKRGYWVDHSTGLMWASKDNGTDVSWKQAVNYCRDLRLAGFSDWRLADMAQLQPIYDPKANAPGLAGSLKKQRTVIWHVKGNLFLTGIQWTSNYGMDNRGRPLGYAYYFDFNSGKPDDDERGYSSGKRALCVRDSNK
jgi:hypothetical protein